MKQVEIYKEALGIMHVAHFTPPDYWRFGYLFQGLCELIFRVADSYLCDQATEARIQFVKDSEKVLGRKLHGWELWFTAPDYDEPLARQERIKHLQNLIKLYEDGTGRDI